MYDFSALCNNKHFKKVSRYLTSMFVQMWFSFQLVSIYQNGIFYNFFLSLNQWCSYYFCYVERSYSMSFAPPAEKIHDSCDIYNLHHNDYVHRLWHSCKPDSPFSIENACIYVLKINKGNVQLSEFMEYVVCAITLKHQLMQGTRQDSIGRAVHWYDWSNANVLWSDYMYYVLTNI